MSGDLVQTLLTDRTNQNGLYPNPGDLSIRSIKQVLDKETASQRQLIHMCWELSELELAREESACLCPQHRDHKHAPARHFFTWHLGSRFSCSCLHSKYLTD